MSGALTIGQLSAECHLLGPPDAAPAIADRAARALRHHLTATLKAALGAWFDRADESVWIIRRLDVPVAAAADAPPDLLAALIARSFGRTLADVLCAGGDGVDAIRFPDRARYLARFVVDAAAGDAGRWYYRPFAGLRALPASAAIRTALLAVPGRGLAALSSLSDRDLTRVLEALEPQDEGRILDDWAPPAPGGLMPRACATAWKELMRASELGIERGRVLFTLARVQDGTPPGMVVRAARALDRALRNLDALPSGKRIASAQEDSAKALDADVREIPPPIMAAMLSRSTGRSGQGPAAEVDAIRTRFGGLFLLLRDLDDLPWQSLTSGWPDLTGCAAASVMRWLTLVTSAGRLQAQDAFSDTPVRRVLGIPDGLTGASVSAWLRRVGTSRRRKLDDAISAGAAPSARRDRLWLSAAPIGIPAVWSDTVARGAHIVLQGFARRLPGFARSTPAHLWRNFLSFDALVAFDDDRIVVRCGRPPLHLVLTLTGMTRGLLAARDATGRSILLFQSEE